MLVLVLSGVNAPNISLLLVQSMSEFFWAA